MTQNKLKEQTKFLFIIMMIMSQITLPFAVRADEIISETPPPLTEMASPPSDETLDLGIINASSSHEIAEIETSTPVTTSSADTAASSTGTISLELTSENTSASSTSSDARSTTIATTSLENTSTTSSLSTVLLETTEEEATTTSTTPSTEDTSSATTTIEAEQETIASTSIVTGDSYSVANILNLVNTNFVNSQGHVNLSNFLETTETIDTRTTSILAMSSCDTESVCVNANDISLNFLNIATIENMITVQAASGGNLIEQAGDAHIQTGDAVAALNLINLANTNFTNANYFLLILNAFKDVLGDIVLPSLTNFTNRNGSTELTLLSLANEGYVNNDVLNTANSGNNQSDTNSSTISTGSSLSYTNIINQVNTTPATNDLALFFRIGGDWQGEVFGGPTGLSWIRTSDGILFSSNSSSSLFHGLTSNVTEHATNTALIRNQLVIDASSGSNDVNDAEAATITTGNARSVANVVNIANSNIIGKNWMLAVVNIFGNFTGNIAFGRPDLWVGAQVLDAPAHINNGTILTYKITTKNNGDSEATKTNLTVAPNTEYLRILDASVPYITNDDGSLSWTLDALSPGASLDITYRATVENTKDGTKITTASQIRAHETDNNHVDNNDSLSIYTSSPPSGGGSVVISSMGGGGSQSYALSSAVSRISGQTQSTPVLQVVRKTETSNPTGTRRSVHQALSIENTGSVSAEGVILHDIIRAPDGTIISDELWEIGIINPQEEIQLTYDATFEDTAPAGTYFLGTHVEGDNFSAQSFGRNGTIVLEEIPRIELVGALSIVSAATALPPTQTPVTIEHKKQTSAPEKLNDIFSTQTALAANEEFISEPSYGGIAASVALIVLLTLVIIMRSARQGELD